MVQVKPPNVDQGGTVTVKLSGKCFNDTFTISVTGHTLGTVTTDAKGKGSGTFTLPCAVTPGSHTVLAVDAIGDVGSGRVRVRPASCPSSPGHQKGHGDQGGDQQGDGPAHQGGQHQPKSSSDLRIAGVDAQAGVPAGAAVVGVAGLLVLRMRKRRQRREFTC
jgi:hypothetical protein